MAERSPDDAGDHAPKIDFSKSLGSAGHEVEDLGWQDVPDTAPVSRDAEAIEAEDERAGARDEAVERAVIDGSGLYDPDYPKD